MLINPFGINNPLNITNNNNTMFNNKRTLFCTVCGYNNHQTRDFHFNNGGATGFGNRNRTSDYNNSFGKRNNNYKNSNNKRNNNNRIYNNKNNYGNRINSRKYSDKYCL